MNEGTHKLNQHIKRNPINFCSSKQTRKKKIYFKKYKFNQSIYLLNNGNECQQI